MDAGAFAFIGKGALGTDLLPQSERHLTGPADTTGKLMVTLVPR
jgi:hypothetical protein